MEPNKKSLENRQSLKLDYRVITIILLLIVAAMLALWRPWEGPKDRTVEVTGQASLTAVPDEFIFYPTYEFKDANKQAALSALGKKSDELTAELKTLGVPDNKIKTNSDAGPDYRMPDDGNAAPTYSLRLTVTVDNKELAQKIQDYLVTTTPTGAVSPQANFSDQKRKELEAKARDEATKDARAKAEQSGRNLGFSLDAVKTVKDGAGFDGIVFPAEDIARGSSPSTQKLLIQPGENELTYTVTVVYFVR